MSRSLPSLTGLQPSSILGSFPKNWRDSWLKERFPDTRETTLGLRRIFVMPTLSSLALLTTVFLLFLMGINFQNSLIYGLSFWLLALIIIAIFFTYKNLAGLNIRAIQSSPCFAGEKAVFELELSCLQGQNKSSVFLGWKNEDVAEVNLQNGSSVRIKLSCSTSQRGYFKPPRINIFTRYPIGLVVAWSYAQLDMKNIVYPAPHLQGVAEAGTSDKNKDDQLEQGVEIAKGSTDFGGIREYQIGDSPKHIHWKTYAKTGKVYTKSFVDYASHDRWLNWHELNIKGIENKLSHLSARILECHQDQLDYGVKLPSQTIQPASGDAHKHACLTALALYGQQHESSSAANVKGGMRDGIEA